MELTEKLLVSMGGWDAFKQARALHAAGRISEASYEPPVLKGRFSEGGKQFMAGLKLRNTIDVENLCPCRDSRVRGIICAHSLAVGLQVLKPAELRSADRGLRSERPAPALGQATDENPVVELTIEGSLRHLEAEISFRYSKPDVANPAKETEALMRLMAAGFQDYKGKAALQGEESVIRFSPPISQSSSRAGRSRKANAFNTSPATSSLSNRSLPSANKATAGWIFTSITSPEKTRSSPPLTSTACCKPAATPA